MIENLVGVGITPEKAAVIVNQTPVSQDLFSVAFDINAAGTNQATATQLNASFNHVSVAALNTGVRLPAGVSIGGQVTIVNRGANPCAIYPALTDVGAQIDSAASFALAANARVTCVRMTATRWNTF